MEALNNTLTSKVLHASILLASGLIALAYAMNQYYLLAVLPLILGVLWLLDHRLRWQHLASLVLVIFSMFCVLGYWLQLSMPVLVLALSAALAAWDLDHFFRRIQAQPPVRAFDRMHNYHIKQLAFVIGIGIALAQAILLIQITLNFWVIFVLSLIVIISLTRVLVIIRSGG
jgi:drug/metabolite transporter (DMT)-like permease